MSRSEDIDNEDEETCPLCLEEFDATDKAFTPCRCGYQVCVWCWHDIIDRLNGKCPACRAAYETDVLLETPDPQALKAAQDSKQKRREKKLGPNGTPFVPNGLSSAEAASSNRANNPLSLEDRERRSDHGRDIQVAPERAIYSNVRVLQRTLLYVVGLPASIAREELLKKKEYFGRFGRIVKIAVNRKPVHSSSNGASYSSYITFKRARDAQKAIETINGSMMDGRVIRATYGTTKYCTYFLRNMTCTNPGCLYLHELANTRDCYTKEDLCTTDKFGVPLTHSYQNGLLALPPRPASQKAEDSDSDSGSSHSGTPGSSLNVPALATAPTRNPPPSQLPLRSTPPLLLQRSVPSPFDAAPSDTPIGASPITVLSTRATVSTTGFALPPRPLQAHAPSFSLLPTGQYPSFGAPARPNPPLMQPPQVVPSDLTTPAASAAIFGLQSDTDSSLNHARWDFAKFVAELDGIGLGTREPGSRYAFANGTSVSGPQRH